MIRAVTLDLDDTLWPFAPIAQRIQSALRAFLDEHAPNTSREFDAVRSMALLEAVRKERPDLAHDLAETRREALRRMLRAADEDPALAEPAFRVLNDARQQVDLYPDAREALARLGSLGPLVAVTNGNADLTRIGLDDAFDGVVHAERVGVAKPDPRIFAIAAERAGVPPQEILHAGDDLHTDVGGALAAGMQAAWVHRHLEGETPDGVLRARDLLHLVELVGA
jgi:FMN hydrolase / 5-amino-6-(5-phospho-D-ribitylamino)uracil phosphatase